jgi:hypothetical protein
MCYIIIIAVLDDMAWDEETKRSFESWVISTTTTATTWYIIGLDYCSLETE